MKITVNGQVRDFPPGETLDTMTRRFSKDAQHVMVELNGAIVDRQAWEKATLRDGDRLELVSFVGGG
jgi:sulfur carrier protein